MASADFWKRCIAGNGAQRPQGKATSRPEGRGSRALSLLEHDVFSAEGDTDTDDFMNAGRMHFCRIFFIGNLGKGLLRQDGKVFLFLPGYFYLKQKARQ